MILWTCYVWNAINDQIMQKTYNNFFNNVQHIEGRATANHKFRKTSQQSFESGNFTREYHSAGKRPAESQMIQPKRMSTSFIANRTTQPDNRYFKSHNKRSQTRSLQRNNASFIYFKQKNKEQLRKQSKGQSQIKSMGILDPELVDRIGVIEEQYIESYENENYDQAAKALIKLLNYFIDFNLPKFLMRTIKQLAQFYVLTNKNNLTLFYYNQTMLCAMLLQETEMMVETLIGSACCCKKQEFFDQAILFLKKGLECCWLYAKSEQELKIYDEIGKVYYLMGDLEKAKKFHQKFINAVSEPENSPQRILSKQRMTKYFMEQSFKIYTEIDEIFLASLTLPIENFTQFPPLKNYKLTLRNELGISTKYFSQFSDIQRLLMKILKSSYFAAEMQQPDMQRSKRNSGLKKKKFDMIDFKMKQHLKDMGIGIVGKIELKPKNLEYKEPLDERVKKKLKEPPLQSNWQQKIVKQIKRDRINNLSKVHSQIRVRGKNRVIRPEVDFIRKIFMPLYK